MSSISGSRHRRHDQGGRGLEGDAAMTADAFEIVGVCLAAASLRREERATWRNVIAGHARSWSCAMRGASLAAASSASTTSAFGGSAPGIGRPPGRPIPTPGCCALRPARRPEGSAHGGCRRPPPAGDEPLSLRGLGRLLRHDPAAAGRLRDHLHRPTLPRLRRAGRSGDRRRACASATASTSRSTSSTGAGSPGIVLRGDFGYSFEWKQPVSALIWERWR